MIDWNDETEIDEEGNRSENEVYIYVSNNGYTITVETDDCMSEPSCTFTSLGTPDEIKVISMEGTIDDAKHMAEEYHGFIQHVLNKNKE